MSGFHRFTIRRQLRAWVARKNRRRQPGAARTTFGQAWDAYLAHTGRHRQRKAIRRRLGWRRAAAAAPAGMAPPAALPAPAAHLERLRGLAKRVARWFRGRP